MKHKSKKGFTLVEIMIVVVIIGLLAAMAIPAFNRVRTQAREKAIINNLRIIASSAQQYMLEEGVESVEYTTLILAGYFSTIDAVTDEDYTLISVTLAGAGEANSISVDQLDDSVGDDGVVVYTF